MVGMRTSRKTEELGGGGKNTFMRGKGNCALREKRYGSEKEWGDNKIEHGGG